MLSTSQQQAVNHVNGPCLTLAGPGSGKTYVLTRRICHLISEEGVNPESILVITFTKAAAIEMKERFFSLMGESAPVVFGTFHSVFLQMLCSEPRFRGYELITGKRKYGILKEVMASCEIPIESDEDLDTLEKDISFVKNADTSVLEFAKETLWGQDFVRLYEHYEARKASYRLMDFDDMLTKARDMLKSDITFREKWQRRFCYILVDEVQDMNAIQYESVRLLALPENNLFVVGDDDQSIYGFRGANPELMLHFQEDYPEAKVIRLGENYRSDGQIVEAAGRLIAHNTNRFAKEVKTHSVESGVWRVVSCEDGDREADYICKTLLQWHKEGEEFCNMAVLFRNHAHCQKLVEALSDAKVPCFLREPAKNPYQHYVMQDLVAYLRLGSKMLHRRDLFRIMNRPNRYFSRASVTSEWITFEHWKTYYKQQSWLYERVEQLERHVNFYGRLSGKGAVKYIRKVVGYDAYLSECARSEDELDAMMQVADAFEDLAKEGASIAELLRRWEQTKSQFDRMNEEINKENNGGVGLYTLHGSKGLEFSRVVMLGCNEGKIPSRRAKTEKQVEEERRLFYVGMTRAKNQLMFTFVEKEKDEKISPSRFLGELQEAVELKN